MIGLDTNVLVRYLVEDDLAQVARIQKFFESQQGKRDPIFVSCLVLCETAWVLRSVYGKNQPQIFTAISQILAVELFRIEEEDVVRVALERYHRGKGDFADYLLGEINLSRGCKTTVTFDRALQSAAFTQL